MYTTEVKVKQLAVSDWLAEYRVGGELTAACRTCPSYGKVWSCPPGVPVSEAYLTPFRQVYVLGVKVIYSRALRDGAVTREEVERAREASYGKVKRTLMEALLALEEAFPDSLTIAAGRCAFCESCTRADGGRPCRYPAHMRYSFSAFGFDLTRISRELLDMELLWAAEGLPEYNVAVAAFLTNQSTAEAVLTGAAVEDGLSSGNFPLDKQGMGEYNKTK